MSKSSYTSVYVKKVAPKFHKVLGYLSNKVRDESIVSVFNQLKLKNIDIRMLEQNKPFPILGNYDWKHNFLIGNHSNSLFYYQLSLYFQRIKFVSTLPWSEKEKSKWVLDNPPLFLMSIKYPTDDYICNYKVSYLRGVILADTPIYVFTPIFPYIHGNTSVLSRDIKKIANFLRIDEYDVIQCIMNIPKFLVSLSDREDVIYVDLMSLPQAYNTSTDVLNLFPPICHGNFLGEYRNKRKITSALDPFKDFDGLAKHRTVQNDRSLDIPDNFESLLSLKNSINMDIEKGQFDNLTEYLKESFKSRIECRIYGYKPNQRIPHINYLPSEAKAHAKTELATYAENFKKLKKSIYTTTNVDHVLKESKIAKSKSKPPA